MEPDPNHGKASIRTSESLKDAYMMCVPSGDPHSASGDDRISSASRRIRQRSKYWNHNSLHAIVNYNMSDGVSMSVCLADRTVFSFPLFQQLILYLISGTHFF